MIEEYRAFLNVFVKVGEKSDIFISEDFENQSKIKGSHLCSILFNYIVCEKISHHSI